MADAIALTNPDRRAAFLDGALGRLGWPLAVGAVFFLQILLILHHQPFVDEWQALQIAVQSPDFSSLIANLRYEGHPLLWYLVLRAVSDIVGPHNALMVTSLGLALTTQGLILFAARSPAGCGC